MARLPFKPDLAEDVYLVSDGRESPECVAMAESISDETINADSNLMSSTAEISLALSNLSRHEDGASGHIH